jgi:hypothetical protein
METLLLYFLKANGLLIVFFLAYYLFLRKETFFQANRWFLLLGIISSFVLPLLTFTEIIWIDPEPLVYQTNTFVPITNFATTPIEKPFDWELFFTYSYALISILLLIKIGIELISFLKIIKNGTKNKENSIVFVETDKSQNPFSFFNYLVFNKTNFTEDELNMIIIHEKVHIEQKHSFDVLTAKLLCIILWINPIVWLYRKAILENLEFIADSKTSETTNNVYQYQKTLLKVVVCNNQLSITNQFYQSLIKKRIVMLNTNQSQRKNIWKYTLVVPFLIAFIFLFQFETVAQVREIEIIENGAKAVEVIEFIIDKNTSDTEIKKETEALKKNYGIELNVSKLKRNKQKEIYLIEVKFKDSEGNTGKISSNGEEPIQPIRFFKELDQNGKGEVGFGGESMKTVFKQMTTNSPNQILIGDSIIEIKTIDIKPQDLPNHPNKKQLYIINGKEYSSEDLKDKKVEVDGSIFHYFKEEAIQKFGEKGKNGVIVFEGKSTISEGDKNMVSYSANKFENINPKNIKLTFIKGKEYIIGGKKYSYNDLKDKDWWLYTGTPHKIEEKNNVVTITGDVVENALEWNTQDVIEVNSEDSALKKAPIKFELANGDVVIIFNNMIKVPSYPSLSLEKIDIVFNNNSIKDNVQFFDKVNPNLIKKIEIDDDMNVIKISTVNSTNIQDDTEIYINNKKASKKEMDKLKPDEIERMDVNKASSGKNVIKIITKKKN